MYDLDPERAYRLSKCSDPIQAAAGKKMSGYTKTNKMAVKTRAAAKKPRLKLKARAYRPIYHTMRGKKSYKAGNILKELAIGKTSWVGAREGMPYRRYRYVTSGPTGQAKYGPTGPKRMIRTRTTRLVSRRCQSKKQCKDWAGKYGGKMTYIKYAKKKFYREPAALEARKDYNKAESRGGRGFIQSYRKAMKAAKTSPASPVRTRRSAAANALRRSVAVKRKRNNGMNKSLIISGPRKRIQTKR
jgi:hypothetical protein